MGLNTVVVILNDTLHKIERDTSFGEKLARAIAAGGTLERHRFDLHDAKIVGSQDSYGNMLVAVGGNTGHYIGRGHEGDVELLRRAADAFGYRKS